MDDVVVIGGGIIGAATAYFLSKEGRKVKVIERDPTYKTASFPLSLGGFRRQYFQKENILLGKFAREFIFQIPELLKTEKNPNPTASMVAKTPMNEAENVIARNDRNVKNLFLSM